MNNKKKTIIIGAIVLVLLIGVLVVLKLTEPKEEDATSSSSTAAAETYALIEKNVDDFTSVDINNADGSYTIDATGDETYNVAYLDGHEQMNAYYKSVVSDLSALNASKKVLDSVEDKAKYGLDNPAASMVVHFGEESYTLYLGNAAADGSFYVMKEGDDALYTVTSTVGGYFTRTPFFYLSVKLVDSYDTSDADATPNVTEVSITRKDLEQPILIERATGDADRTYMSAFQMTSPVASDMNYNADSDYIMAFFGKSAESVVALYDEADAAKYGFDDPTAVISLTYDSITKKFTVGSKDAETGNYYVLLNDNGLVYEVTEANLVCMTVQPKDLISSLALLPNILDMKGVDVTLDGQLYSYTITNETTPAETSDESDTTDTTAVTCNGSELKVDNFKKYYQLLLSASVEDIYSGEVSGDPLCSIVYHYTDGRADESVVFYDIGNRTVAVSINGEIRFTGRYAYFEKLRTETENLLNGKEVDTDW